MNTYTEPSVAQLLEKLKKKNKKIQGLREALESKEGLCAMMENELGRALDDEESDWDTMLMQVRRMRESQGRGGAEGKMPTITITHKDDGAAIYSVEAVDLRDAVQRAVKKRVSLMQADLSGADLRRADLGGADLHGADLHRADLSGASLVYADLRGADLRWASLLNANLHDADLRDAALYGSMWAGAGLSGALGVILGWDGQVEGYGV